MDQSEVLTVMQDAITTILTVAAPMLIVAMVVGVIVSIFQATTQINEQTLAFVPKIVAVLLVLLVCGGLILTNITEFSTRMFGYVDTMLK
ncbi:MAG: flagellar biosynthesis protein FliQ [Eubacteriales bacterium]|nr:flagellar biosynthesis protein FliQ [Eubacteriales bacterium]